MKTKIFRVWTHYGITPVEVEAATRSEALAKGLALVADNPPFHPARDESGYYCNENGPVETHFVPKRPADPIPEPYARVKPQPRPKWHGYNRR